MVCLDYEQKHMFLRLLSGPNWLHWYREVFPHREEIEAEAICAVLHLQTHISAPRRFTIETALSICL
jgi:hypothetical protein